MFWYLRLFLEAMATTRGSAPEMSSCLLMASHWTASRCRRLSNHSLIEQMRFASRLFIAGSLQWAKLTINKQAIISLRRSNSVVDGSEPPTNVDYGMECLDVDVRYQHWVPSLQGHSASRYPNWWASYPSVQHLVWRTLEPSLGASWFVGHLVHRYPNAVVLK